MKRIAAAWCLAGVTLGGACSREVKVSAAHRAEAAAIWKTRCTNCHGPEGQGDGPGALVLTVRPRALANPGWQRGVTDERLRTVIVGGGRAVGLSDAMPANPDLEDDPAVLWALVQHIRALASP